MYRIQTLVDSFPEKGILAGIVLHYSLVFTLRTYIAVNNQQHADPVYFW